MKHPDPQWLAALPTGQQVAIYRSGHVQVAEVSRHTPTLVVVLTEQGERKFRHDSGRQVGGEAELLPIDSSLVVSSLVRQTYDGAMLAVSKIERTVDRTNPRSPELHAVALREAREALGQACATVDTLLGSRATERKPDDVEQ